MEKKEDFFKDSILEISFRERREDFIDLCLKKNKKQELAKSIDLYKELITKIEKSLENGEIKDNIFKLIDELFTSYSNELYFWEENFYRLGFSDAKVLKEEVKNLNS